MSRPVTEPCGTLPAYQRHVRRGEPMDPACLAAQAAHMRKMRQPGREPGTSRQAQAGGYGVAVARARSSGQAPPPAPAWTAEGVAAAVTAQVRTGQMTALPPVADLAAVHGVSEATVARALRLLRAAGTVLPPRRERPAPAPRRRAPAARPRPPRPEPPGWDVVRAHLRHLGLRGRSPLTVGQRERILLRLAAALPVPLAEATADQLYDWRAGLTMSGPTIAGYLSHVREFYAWLAATGRRPDDPAAALPVPPVPRRLPRPIAEDDLSRALAGAPPRIRVWLVLAGWCGLRACEIAGLRADSIRLRDPSPVLMVRWNATKGIRERAVPLSDFAVRELEAACLPVTGYAFLAATGEPFSPWMISKLCNRYLHECGLSDTLHSARHRFGTASYAVNHDILAVSELLGHAHIQTTAGYAAVERSAARAIVAALPVPGS